MERCGTYKLYDNAKYWRIRGRDVRRLYSQTPNGTGADAWIFINNSWDDGIVICSERAIDCINSMTKKGVLSIDSINSITEETINLLDK